MSSGHLPESGADDQESDATFNSAAEYSNLTEASTRPEVKRKATSRNDIIRRRASESQIPIPDEDVLPQHGFQRRGYALDGIRRYEYKPGESTEQENIQTYNMFRRILETTQPTEPAGNERIYAEEFRRLEAALFGEEGPELVQASLELHGEAHTFDYNGQPIELTLDPDHDPGSSDFELYQVIGGQGEHDLDPSWVVRRPSQGRGVSVNNQFVRVPADGLTLGREMSVPGLEVATRALSQKPAISRQHVTIVPQEDGRIQIVDSSTNGTRVREGHWQRRQEQAQPDSN